MMKNRKEKGYLMRVKKEVALLRFDGDGNNSGDVPPITDEGIITTLHPKGSQNDLKVDVPKREITRPYINYLLVVANVLVVVIVFVVISYWHLGIALGVASLYILCRLRSIAIWCVRMYQRYADEDIRRSCVFNPSCSEYMILSIKKHGVIFGGIKGWKRLKRCHLPNCGDDFP